MPPPPKGMYGMEGEWEGMEKKESKATSPTGKKEERKTTHGKKGNAMEEGYTNMSVGYQCNEPRKKKNLEQRTMELQHMLLCRRQESRRQMAH